MILQLNPPIEMQTIKGRGFANFLIDYGLESDLYWVVFQDSGEIWTWANKEVVITSNVTANRPLPHVSITEEDFKFVDTWPFGKYRGYFIGDVPKTYLKLIYSSGCLNMPENLDLKKTLIHLGLIDG